MPSLEEALGKKLRKSGTRKFPLAFKAAITNASDQILESISPINGELRYGLLGLRRNADVMGGISADEHGNYLGFSARGVFTGSGSRDLVSVGVGLHGSWYYITVQSPQGSQIADEILGIFDLNVTEKNPLSGKIFNIEGEVASAEPVSWDYLAIPPDFGEDLESNIIWPMQHYEELVKKGLYRPRGVLMAGEVGMGKSLAGNIVAQNVSANGGSVVRASAADIITHGSWGYVFEVAGTLRPTLVYVEDLDKGGATGDNAMYQLAEYLNGLEDRKDVMMLATTNELAAVDRRLRERPRRFDRVLNFDSRDSKRFGRDWKERVLSIHLNGSAELDANPAEIAAMLGNSPYNGAHLQELVETARDITLQQGGIDALAGDGRIKLDQGAIYEARRRVETSFTDLKKNPLGFGRS